MNAGPILFLVTFFTLAVSWLGFVFTPQLQMGNQQQVVSPATGDLYPRMRPGMARQGELVYRANGCVECHTQQLRPKGMGGDAERWGGRNGVMQSVNEDYLYDNPAMLGTQRIGPDLANIGLRQTNETILMVHLYDPQLTMPKSVMPPYRYLFEKRKLAVGQKPSEEALPSNYFPEMQGYEVVPTDAAKQLVAYLQSLHSDTLVFETPPFPASTNTAPQAAATNSAPTNNSAK